MSKNMIDEMEIIKNAQSASLLGNLFGINVMSFSQYVQKTGKDNIIVYNLCVMSSACIKLTFINNILKKQEGSLGL